MSFVFIFSSLASVQESNHPCYSDQHSVIHKLRIKKCHCFDFFKLGLIPLQWIIQTLNTHTSLSLSHILNYKLNLHFSPQKITVVTISS